MTVAEIIAFISSWAKQFPILIDRYEKNLNKRILAVQEVMYDELAAQLMQDIAVTDGQINRTAANIKKANRLNQKLDAFQRSEINRELRLFASEIVDVARFSGEYFRGIDSGVKGAQIARAIDLLRATIGIDENNALLPDGYLYRLGQAADVREELRAYVVRSINAGETFANFQKGFRQLVKGGQNVDGALVRYWRQYAYDTYNQAHEVVSAALADDLGLEYFIYQGSVIPTTRQFCREKAGKVFTTNEAKKNWPKDRNLIDPKTVAQYRPLIDRGRYNCRHFLTYISEETAKQLRNDL